MKNVQYTSDKTPVRLGIILSVSTLILGVLFGACWWSAAWTAGVNVKLDNILIQNAAAARLQAKINEEVADLKAWRKLIDANGSQQVQLLEKTVQILTREVELHKARDDEGFKEVRKPGNWKHL